VSPMSNSSTKDLPRLSVTDLISANDLPTGDIQAIFDTAARLKKSPKAYARSLEGKRLAMFFEKESLRTRMTFDVGIQDLDGSAVFMDQSEVRLGTREAIKDVAKNLERWMDGLVLRTYKHRTVQEFAEHGSIPVVNGLTDYMHPCQALSDTFTLTEKWGTVKGRTLAYVGDGNNTCHSLIHTAAKLGMHMRVASPEGYEPNSRIVNEAMNTALETKARITILTSPQEAVKDADVVYTDVWASMGQEHETEERAETFSPYQVNEELMALAKPGAYFLHCLPAHRGAEVTAGVIDSPCSIVYDNAENRYHVQKAILLLLMADRD
jgi:ornithine carbamoyltransferase